MPPPVDPVTSPVTFPFENGAIKLVTVIDPVSGCHTVVYDLCDKSIPLGILGIQEQVTTDWRRQNNIPDSDGFDIYLQDPQVDKRDRSDTVSTANSDKHDGKRHKLGYIQE
jgi:hypothetical protein